MWLLPRIVAWSVALAWMARALETLRGLPTVPNLLLSEYDASPEGSPRIAVIVPARNEQADVGECIRSLLAQDYPGLTIIAVDDRSTDATGAVMESLARNDESHRLKVIHVAELPEAWLGKPHAMAVAAELAIAECGAEFLLFTDADVLFRPDAVRRALAYGVESGADHLVLVPTMTVKRWDEAALLSFFQVFALWAARPWKVADPKALRDAIGIGAFNLLRTTAYRRVGGFEALRMEIVEDLGLARRVKLAGLAQRLCYGRDLASVHWARGIKGIVNVITKNLFAVFRFRVWLLLLGCAHLALLCLMPFVAVWSAALAVPAALTIGSIFLMYRLLSSRWGLSAWYGLLAPFSAALLVYALLRSMATTLRQGGVVWRGTFYPLAELRKHATPMFPRRPK